jgi:hypothetical protein
VRALSVGDILDGAFRLLRASFGRVALLVLIVVGPVQLLSAFVTTRLLPDPFAVPEVGQEMPVLDDAAVASLFSATALTGLLGFIVHVLVSGAIVWLVLREAPGSSVEPGQALRGSLGRAWPLLGGSALVGLLWMAVAFVVVAVIAALFMVAWPLAILVAIPTGVVGVGLAVASTSLVIPVAMLEPDAGAGRVAGRALGLVRRRLGRMLGVTLLVMLVLMVVTFAVTMVLGIASFVAGPVGWVVDGVTGTLAAVITTPVTALAALLLYIDARVRLEGWDLQLRARAPRPW